MLDLTVDEWNAIPPEHKCIAVEYRDTVIKAKMVRDLFRRVSQTDETTDDAQLID